MLKLYKEIGIDKFCGSIKLIAGDMKSDTT